MYMEVNGRASGVSPGHPAQGYLARKKQRPPMTLQEE